MSELPKVKVNRLALKAGKKPGSIKTLPGKREVKIVLPTTKSTPAKDISRFKYYFFGGRKVGKSSFASEFPDCLNLFSEPSGSDYTIYALNLYTWDEVLDTVQLIEEQGEAGTLIYKNVSFDIVDKFYKWLVTDVCARRGCAEEDLGWGWDQVKAEFEDIINRLAKYVGIVFIAHVKEREIDRADGTKYATLMPSSMKNCFDLISSICDLTGYFYINPQNKRMLRILPHMESTTGNRFENHFNWRTGGKIDEIDMGLTKQDAYSAFKAAFNNELDRPVQEVEEVSDVSEEDTTPLPVRKKFKVKGK